MIASMEKAERRRHLGLLIKPASGRCNMRCAYCFYADEAENRSFRDCGLMSADTAHVLIDKAFAAARSVSFAFQGGEPTVRGLDFFRDFVSYASRYGGDVRYAIQTNGYAIDGEWVDFFKENHFLVGLSLDGNKAIHDLYRTGRDGKGSFRRVFATAERFRSSGVDFNILSTVNRDVAADIEGIYAFFKRNGFRYQQYIPCIDPIASERGTMPYSLTAELYGGFLIRLFDLYYRDWSRGDYVSIRYIDNLVSMMAGYRPEQCGLFGFCPKNYVFEADGSAYPCDFYVLDGYRLGNIMEDGFDDFDARSSEIGFSEKSAEADAECRSCSCFPICRGGCRRDREDFSTGQLGRSYLCPAYKSFFAHALPYLRQMGEAEAAARRRG